MVESGFHKGGLFALLYKKEFRLFYDPGLLARILIEMVRAGEDPDPGSGAFRIGDRVGRVHDVVPVSLQDQDIFRGGRIRGKRVVPAEALIEVPAQQHLPFRD